MWEQGSREVDIRNPWIWGGSIMGIEFASGGGWGREVNNVKRGLVDWRARSRSWSRGYEVYLECGVTGCANG